MKIGLLATVIALAGLGTLQLAFTTDLGAPLATIEQPEALPVVHSLSVPFHAPASKVVEMEEPEEIPEIVQETVEKVQDDRVPADIRLLEAIAAFEEQIQKNRQNPDVLARLIKTFGSKITKIPDGVGSQRILWLLQDLGRDPKPRVRSLALNLASHVEGAVVTTWVEQVLASDPNSEVRSRAVMTLPRNEETVSLIGQLISVEPNKDVKKKMVSILGEIRGADASRILWNLAENTMEEDAVRIKAIAKIGPDDGNQQTLLSRLEQSRDRENSNRVRMAINSRIRMIKLPVNRKKATARIAATRFQGH